MTLAVVAVSGRYVGPDDTPAAGTVEFVLSSPLQDAAGDTIVAASRERVVLDADGRVTVGLVATDDPAAQPAGVVYQVTERIAGAEARSYSIGVPHTLVTLDLADVAPVVAGPQVFTYALAAELAGHEQDPTDAHLASAVGFTPPSGWDATDVQEAVVEAAVRGGSAAAGPAGGVLSGAYPDPDFAVSMATQAELDAETAARAAADNAEASARATADLLLMPKAGGTFTGPVLLASDPTAAMNPATMQWVVGQVDAAAALLLTKASNLADVANPAAARGNLGLGSAAVHPASDFDLAGAAAAAQAAAEAASQPLNADLTAIAAAGTTSFGRSLLAVTDAPAARAAVGLGSAAVLDAGVAGGVATLDSGGKVPQAQIPAVALTDYLGAVASQAAMLALVGQRGDWCTRTDRGTDWQLIADDPTVLANWREHVYPASPVSSVNGRTGAVTGLAEASDLTAEAAARVTADALLVVKTANLGDLADVSAARGNLGLGSAATLAAGDFDLAGAATAAAAPKRNSWNVRSVSSDASAAADDYLLADTTGGTFVVTAPTPTAGRVWGVKWLAGAVAPTLAGSYNGAPVFSVPAQAMEFVADGAVWHRTVRPALAQIPDYPALTDARYVALAGGSTITGATSLADLLHVTLPAFADASHAGLHLSDVAANAAPLFAIDNFGSGNALDIKVWPTATAGSGLALHGYAAMQAGQAIFIIDNTSTGAMMKWKNTEGSNNTTSNGSGNFLEIYAYEGATQFTDGAMTTGSAVLTSASAPFKTSDVGKPIQVNGAGVASANLQTTILSVQSTSQVTVAAAASSTVSAATFLVPLAANVNIIAKITGNTPAFGGSVGALRFINMQTGVHNTKASPWSFENNSNNGAFALQVIQSASNTAAALLVNNLNSGGTLFALQAAGTNKLVVDGNGSLTRVGNITMNNGSTDGTIAAGTSTGLKIGTATGQKIGFWNATPVIQPTGTPAAATDLTSVIALANSLRTNLLSVGLVA